MKHDQTTNPEIQQGGCQASASLDCSELIDAIEELLPRHSISCVSGFEMRDRPWSYDVDSTGNPLVTRESCNCCERTKEIRDMLAAHKQSDKGYSPNDQALPQTERPTL